MKFEITDQQLNELEKILIGMPYQFVKPVEARVGQLLESIRSQKLEESTTATKK